MPRWSSRSRLPSTRQQRTPPSLLLATLLALVLAACVDSPYRTSNRQEAKGDGTSVVITGSHNEAEARSLAEDYCRAHGGAAHFKGMVQYHMRRETAKVASFDCHA